VNAPLRSLVRPCPRCGTPRRVYYDRRDTWAVCLRCRVGYWIGTGYDRPPDGIATDPVMVGRWAADTGARVPSVGAIWSQAMFWRDGGAFWEDDP